MTGPGRATSRHDPTAAVADLAPAMMSGSDGPTPATAMPATAGPGTSRPTPPTRGRGLSPWAAWLALGGFTLVIVAHAFGLFGTATYPVVTASGAICALVGLRSHRPTLRWPWLALAATAALWTVAGVVSDASDSAGDLSRSRSLVPDLFALPAYVVFGVALQGLYAARRPRSERHTLLDGVMLATGVSLVVHELVIAPTLGIEDAWPMAQVAVAVYPALSMCLLVIALRLAFAGGERSVAFILLLAGSASLLIGDIVYAFGEIGRFQAPTALLEVPYLFVPAFMGAAVLHPTIRIVARPSRAPIRELGPGRLLAVAFALFTPIVVIATHRGPNGTTVMFVLSVVLTATAVIRIVASMRAQTASEAELHRRATHDDLTGLPNRPLLLERTEELLDSPDARGVALLFLDVDQFKFINDSMGHQVGDALLVAIADRIVTSVRDDDVVGRISGDEFVIIGVGLDAAGGYALADRVRQSLGEPFWLVSGEVFVTASIGVAVAEGGGHDAATTLFQEADTAMYRSKEAGRNTTTLFDTSMRDGIARRMNVEHALRRALDRSELDVAYQPIIDVPRRRIVGFEALVRWQLDGTKMSPEEFIPIAEDSGMIVPLGSFVLDEACRQLAWWRANLIADLTVSVNMSPRQVRASDVVDTVAATLRRHDLPPEALWLEITESAMMEDSLTTSAAMSGLQGLGVRLAVDDFGTGFSSLSYLKRFPVSRVKIDQSFVAGLGLYESDSSLVAAIAAMADALGLGTVAEGVETNEQAARLLELGCTQMQGYLYAPAVPAAEVPSLVTAFGPTMTRRAARTRRCTSAEHTS